MAKPYTSPQGEIQSFPGLRFGRLILIERRENLKASGQRWLCRCDCGFEKVIRLHHLRSGSTVSCGCVGHASKPTHGLTKTAEYRVWSAMKERCSRPQNKSFEHYGGRGISVCERWRTSFTAFIDDMGSRPSPKHSIERENNDGNYEPGNCRWATAVEQRANRRPMGSCSPTKPPSYRYARSKLSREDVVAIRSTYAAGGVSLEKLGAKYGVIAETIWYVVHRRTWRNVA